MKKIRFKDCSYSVFNGKDEVCDYICKVNKENNMLIRFRADMKCILIIDDNLMITNQNKVMKNISRIELDNWSITNKLINIDKILNNDMFYKQVCELGLMTLWNPNNQKYFLIEVKKIDIEKELSKVFQYINTSKW